MTTRTRVIHVRFAPKDWFEDDEHFAYIGRRTAAYGFQGEKAVFGNPYFLVPGADDEERDRICNRYEVYLKARLIRDVRFMLRVRDLAGKTLVCFCKPKRCHGDALAAAADQLQHEHSEWVKTLKDIPPVEEAIMLDRVRREVEAENAQHRHDIGEHLEALKRGFDRCVPQPTTGFHRPVRRDVPTGMPPWFKRWREDYWKPMIESDRENNPAAYRLCEQKLKFNYD